MTTARVHSFETFGSVDGPGVRFVVFLQGCKMRCRFCHNPDSWRMDAGDEYTAEEILNRAIRYKSYWGKDGGITVSGGEPLLQIDFLIEFFKLCKAQGIHTCLDTAALPFTRQGEWFKKFEELMPLTDLILLDLKHVDPAQAKALTGFTNEREFDCARYLSEIGKPVWIRHVLVPGYTDDDKALNDLAAFIKTLTNVERVEVLPFHNLAQFKWEKLGIPYRLKDVDSPTQERVDNAKRILESIVPYHK